MRRSFIAVFATLTLILGAISVAPAAHAQTPPTQNQVNAANELGTPAQQAATGQGTAAQQAAAALTTQQAQTLYQQTADKTATPPNLEDAPAQFGTVMTWIMSLFAWLVGVAAMTLDYSVYYTVVTMGSYVHKLSAVGVAWRILRDIGNIALIFGFLAVGITTILNVDWYGGGKKMLPMMLLAAVFLNFSLFFSEAIIDVGNLFATQFYTQINGGQAPTSDFLSTVNPSNEGISNKIMAQLGLQTIYNPNTNKDAYQGGNTWLIGFLGSILFIITAFVMFSLAFILIARFVALIFLIILAPVGFAGLAVPMLAKRASQWWSKLFEQTITAPILLLMLYIALAIITDAQFLTGVCGAGTCTKSWLGFVTGNDLTGFASMMLSFLVAMGLLLAVTMQAKNLSAFGASLATKTAGALTLGATAYAGRTTFGWGAQRLSQRLEKSTLARVPIVGRGIMGALDRGAKGSFDLRATGAFKQFPGGVEAGTAEKGGYRDWEKGKIKEREEYAKRLVQTSGEKEQQKVEEGRQKMMEESVKVIETQNKKEAQDLLERQRDELGVSAEATAAAQKKLTKMLSDQQMGATVSDTEIAAAQADLTAAQTAQREKTSEHKKQREELQKTHEQLVAVQQEEVEVRKKEVERLKQAPQEGYAAGITWGPGQFFKRNVKAAENIRKEVKKGKSEKDLEKIKKFLEEGDKPKEEKKEEAPKPAAAH